MARTPAQPQQPPDRQRAASQRTDAAASGPRRDRRARTKRKVSQTSHTVRLDGRDIKYTATTGTLPIRCDDGKVAARMFFVAYTKDGEDAKTRPVSFLYNGGPGAATVWLHMGSFAPKHVQMADEGFQPAPPYHLVDNENSLIDVTDLVFVDAISTGYSRTVAGVDAAQFHGQQGDLRAFGDFINEYLKTYSRWPSPKFLIGESYGTIRSAGLVAGAADAPRHRAERHRPDLVAAHLPDDLDRRRRTTSRCVLVLPDLHGDRVVPQEAAAGSARQDLKKAVDEARAFATGEYATALHQGQLARATPSARRWRRRSRA